MAVRMHRLVAVCLPTPAYSFVVRQQVDEPAASRLAALLSLLLSSPFIRFAFESAPKIRNSFRISCPSGDR